MIRLVKTMGMLSVDMILIGIAAIYSSIVTHDLCRSPGPPFVHMWIPYSTSLSDRRFLVYVLSLEYSRSFCRRKTNKIICFRKSLTSPPAAQNHPAVQAAEIALSPHVERSKLRSSLVLLISRKFLFKVSKSFLSAVYYIKLRVQL